MLETKRLVLKEYDEKDIEKAHLNFFSSEITARYVLWRPTKNKEEVKRKLDYWVKELKIFSFFIIHEKNSDEPIGFISFDKLGENIYGDIGIVIGEKFVKKGYASEALMKIINHIKSLGGKEIYYSHFSENEASKRLALKFGFEYYKRDKRIRGYDNKEFNEMFYVLKI